MRQTTSSRLAFSKENVGVCICPKCPVQGASACVKGKLSNISEALNKEPLQHEDIPGVYCAAGTATCQDLDPSQPCICETCAVFRQNKLANGQPVRYYCRDGMSR